MDDRAAGGCGRAVVRSHGHSLHELAREQVELLVYGGVLDDIFHRGAKHSVEPQTGNFPRQEKFELSSRNEAAPEIIEGHVLAELVGDAKGLGLQNRSPH